jgi:hypothetical protein
MMIHNSESYKIVLKAKSLLNHATSLYHSASRDEKVSVKVHLEDVIFEIEELADAMEEFVTYYTNKENNHG